MTEAGYSGTPLRKKLGVLPGQTTWRLAMPDAIAAEIDGDMPPLLLETPATGLESAHIFTTSRAELNETLTRLRALLVPKGMVWVSWPKKASKVPTDITEDVVRALALPMGFVDVKVCVIDAIWSGLKLVIRVSQR